MNGLLSEILNAKVNLSMTKKNLIFRLLSLTNLGREFFNPDRDDRVTNFIPTRATRC